MAKSGIFSPCLVSLVKSTFLLEITHVHDYECQRETIRLNRV